MTRVTAPLYEVTLSQKHWGMAHVVRISQCYLPPTRLSANGMNHAFAFPAEAGLHFTNPGRMEVWVELVVWLHT